MSIIQLTKPPVASTGMLIRKPVAEVFEAFADPDAITNFWFTKSSGRLEPGKQVQWDWEMYGLSASVTVKTVEPCSRIVFEWPGHGGATTVEWLFAAREDGSTFVSISNSGFSGDGDAVVAEAIDMAGGFSFVLAGAKAYLELGVRLNLTADRHPDGCESDTSANNE